MKNLCALKVGESNGKFVVPFLEEKMSIEGICGRKISGKFSVTD